MMIQDFLIEILKISSNCLREHHKNNHNIITISSNLLSPLSEDAVNAFSLAVILGFHLRGGDKWEWRDERADCSLNHIQAWLFRLKAGEVSTKIWPCRWTYNVVVVDHLLHLCVGVELVHQLETKTHKHEATWLIKCLIRTTQNTVNPWRLFKQLNTFKILQILQDFSSIHKVFGQLVAFSVQDARTEIIFQWLHLKYLRNNGWNFTML